MAVTSSLPKTIGWVGLGLMGYPMALNLVKKMDPHTKFFVYDILQENVEKFVSEEKSRIEACESSEEVADKSVRAYCDVFDSKGDRTDLRRSNCCRI